MDTISIQTSLMRNFGALSEKEFAHMFRHLTNEYTRGEIQLVSVRNALKSCSLLINNAK